MKYITHTPVVTIGDATFWVNARKSGLYTNMLKQFIGQISAMLSHHNKIHIIRFDLRMSDFTLDNECISKFNRRLFGKIESRYNTLRIGFIWVREQEEADQQHYHYTLILDGNMIQHPYYILEMAGEVWEHMDGSRWVPKNCYCNVRRNDHDALQKAIWRISYLAKGRGKGKRPPQTKDYSTSRITAKLTA